MKKVLLIMVMCFCFKGMAQDIFGKWETVDEDGVSKSIVKIYKKEGKVFGEIVKIIAEKDRDAICTKCKGADKGKPILGFVLIRGLEKDGKYYRNGTIFDPENGKEYQCRLILKDDNTLQVRGYISFLYSTQYWKRTK